MTLTAEQSQQIPKLIEEGKTIKEVAIYFGCSTKSVSDRIKRLRDVGIEVKTKRGRPLIKII